LQREHWRAGERMRTDEAFDAFYLATYRRVLGQVFTLVGSVAEAEDAVQEAYARAWQRWARLDGYADPEAWVRRVAYRIAVSSWRKTVNRLLAHRRLGPPDQVAGASVDQLALRDALLRLPPEQRVAVVLHHLVGLSVEEIAAETATPVGTVKSRLSRGRRALAEHVGEPAEGTVQATGER
jgi:RNA polymerase sigma-70 factor (sigma-E family)